MLQCSTTTCISDAVIIIPNINVIVITPDMTRLSLAPLCLATPGEHLLGPAATLQATMLNTILTCHQTTVSCHQTTRLLGRHVYSQVTITTTYHLPLTTILLSYLLGRRVINIACCHLSSISHHINKRYVKEPMRDMYQLTKIEIRCLLRNRSDDSKLDLRCPTGKQTCRPFPL